MMKMEHLLAVTIALLAGLGSPARADFSTDWYTVDSGGVLWTAGGPFELSGTIGQPDAGVLGGGPFELIGGFWSAAPAFPPGDLTCDGQINAFDIDPFVLALTDPAGYALAYPDCDAGLADINGDGSVNVFDIDPFVELLAGP